MKKYLLFLFSATLLTSIFTVIPGRDAHAEPTSMFILDASGSMWGRLPDRQSKISVARKVMGNLVGTLPNNISAGLIAYGHRRKGDCSDIEVILEARAGGGRMIASELHRLVPRGKTPISDALKLAGEKLTGIEDATTIVLVSDGIETCKGDPCAVAEALAKAHANLKIHVVGYGVNRAAGMQLQCIAEKGRGGYFGANNTGDLTTALTRVTESIKTLEPIKVEQPIVDDTATSININVTGPGTIRLKLGAWTHMPKYWKVLNPETGEVIARTTKGEVEVMPGQYQIAWRHLEHGAEEVTLPQVVDVKSGEVSEALVTTGLQLNPPQGMKRPYFWQLLTDTTDLKKWYSKRTPAAWYWVWDAVPVPAGEYTLVMRQTEHGHSQAVLGKITLEEGKLTQLPLDQGINLQWPKSWGRLHYMKLTDAAGRKMKMEYRGPIVLAPGTYDVALRLKEHTHNEASFGKITVPEKGFIDARLTSGITFLTDRKGEFTVYATDLDTGAESKMYKSWGPMPLGAGRYRFDLKLGHGKRQTIVPELKIAPGQFVKAKM